jgi:AcrR family transcriptional regulator
VSSSVSKHAPTRKQVLTDLRRQEILSAAIKVFGKKGFAATCVDDIAAAAHIAKGTLYLYFKSKEDIYATAVNLAIARLQSLADERIRSALGIRDRLSAAIAVRMEFWSDQQSLYRLLLTVGREPRHRRQTIELMRSGHGHFRSILETARLANQLPPGSPSEPDNLDTVAWAILDLIRGANERRMDKYNEDRTPQQDASAITALALKQLGL